LKGERKEDNLTDYSRWFPNEHDWFGLTQIMYHDFEARKTNRWVGFWALDKETDKSGEK
jgi:hypothetical protein